MTVYEYLNNVIDDIISAKIRVSDRLYTWCCMYTADRHPDPKEYVVRYRNQHVDLLLYREYHVEGVPVYSVVLSTTAAFAELVHIADRYKKILAA